MTQSRYIYPVRIGKHIVCIYKQLVGVNPEPPYFLFTEKESMQRKMKFN